MLLNTALMVRNEASMVARGAAADNPAPRFAPMPYLKRAMERWRPRRLARLRPRCRTGKPSNLAGNTTLAQASHSAARTPPSQPARRQRSVRKGRATLKLRPLALRAGWIGERASARDRSTGKRAAKRRPFSNQCRNGYCPFFASATALSRPFCISSIDFCASPGLSSHFDSSVPSALSAPSYLAMSCWL